MHYGSILRLDLHFVKNGELNFPNTSHLIKQQKRLMNSNIILKMQTRHLLLMLFLMEFPKIPPRFKIIKNESGEIIERIPINLEEELSKKDYDLYNKVTTNQFYLIDILLIDHLNANRTVLLRDYDSILEAMIMHPILSELFLGKPIPRDKGDDYERLKALDGYTERENHFVVNIDSSQHRSIDQTTKSQVVVIQGPPVLEKVKPLQI